MYYSPSYMCVYICVFMDEMEWISFLSLSDVKRKGFGLRVVNVHWHNHFYPLGAIWKWEKIRVEKEEEEEKECKLETMLYKRLEKQMVCAMQIM